MSSERKASCLCGAVKYTAALKSDHVEICHCGICRKWSAGPLVGSAIDVDTLHFTSEVGLAWYKSSDWAERGFCKLCGTSLFYRLQDASAKLLIAMIGAVDDNQGLTLERHVCIDTKPDYYDFADTCPRLTAEELFAESS